MPIKPDRCVGFSLLELLLAAALGLLIVGAASGALLGEQRWSSLLGERLLQRQWLQQANSLIASDLRRGVAIAGPGSCPLRGREPVLQILHGDGSSTIYSVGPAPSPIWRGWVLMRCGQAFGLDGQVNAAATPQNRVVLDGLDPQPEPWQGCALPEADALAGSEGLPLAVCHEPTTQLLQWQLRLRVGKQRLQGGGSALLNG